MKLPISYKAIVLLCSAFLLGGNVSAQYNPFVTHIYTADPSAHVWEDGRLYVYPSQDIFPAHGCDRMDKYHVFSTEDLIEWTDHGQILAAKDVSWGRPGGGFMWAPDCAYKNGKYYFYFPHPTGEDDWNSTWKIGVAISDKPASDFVVQGYIEGLKSLIDPCIFVDDDGQAYIYHGGGNLCEGGKLKDNMIELDGEMKKMTGLADFHEGPWVHKYNGYYYLSYADNNSQNGNQLRYAMSKNPLGPWVSRGVYMKPTGSATDHGSIVEYKGHWFAFYHNSHLSGGHDWLRSICVDRLYYNEDGTIQEVKQTREWDASDLFTSIDKEIMDSGFAIYYSNGNLYVETVEQYRDIQLTLFDLSGNQILTTDLQPEISVPLLKQGLYLAKMQSGDKYFTRKIVVNR